MLAPVSSWAAAVASYVPDGFPGSRISMFLSQIPWNYYCILTLIMVIVISVLNIDYGPMLTHEYNAQVKDDLFTTPERPFEGADDYGEGEKHSSVLDLLLPVIVLILAALLAGFNYVTDPFARSATGLCSGFRMTRPTTRVRRKSPILSSTMTSTTRISSAARPPARCRPNRSTRC